MLLTKLLSSVFSHQLLSYLCYNFCGIIAILNAFFCLSFRFLLFLSLFIPCTYFSKCEYLSCCIVLWMITVWLNMFIFRILIRQWIEKILLNGQTHECSIAFRSAVEFRIPLMQGDSLSILWNHPLLFSSWLEVVVKHCLLNIYKYLRCVIIHLITHLTQQQALCIRF